MSDSFAFGPIRIYYYSLALALAVWIGYWLAAKRAKQVRLGQNQLTDILLLVLVSGVAGARLGYVAQNLTEFVQRPGLIFQLTTGGLSIHGALLAGALALWWYGRRHTIAFLKLTDLFVLPSLAGQVIGRFGNYFNQELYGYPTNLPWGISIDFAHRLPGYLPFSRFHPVFLYEAILNGIGFVILYRLNLKRTGQLTGGYLIVSSVSRFVAEIFRISDRLLLSLSLAQIISLGLLVLGIYLVRKGRD